MSWRWRVRAAYCIAVWKLSTVVAVLGLRFADASVWLVGLAKALCDHASRVKP